MYESKDLLSGLKHVLKPVTTTHNCIELKKKNGHMNST